MLDRRYLQVKDQEKIKTNKANADIAKEIIFWIEHYFLWKLTAIFINITLQNYQHKSLEKKNSADVFNFLIIHKFILKLWLNL